MMSELGMAETSRIPECTDYLVNGKSRKSIELAIFGFTEKLILKIRQRQ